MTLIPFVHTHILFFIHNHLLLSIEFINFFSSIFLFVSFVFVEDENENTVRETSSFEIIVISVNHIDTN